MVRDLKPEDLPALRSMAEASGFPYVNLESDKLIEAVIVVADDEDRPVMAVAARRLVELYLWCSPNGGDPHVKIAAIRDLHDAMAEQLRAKGYNSVEAYLPPSVSEAFGKRLVKTFGWVKNWASWTRRF